MKPKWRNTFNGMIGSHGFITYAAEVAKKAGYSFLAWNDRIYDLKTGDPTGHVVRDNKIIDEKFK